MIKQLEAKEEVEERTDADQVHALLAARTYLYTLFHKCFGGVPSSELLCVLENAATLDAVRNYSEEDQAMEAFASFLVALSSKDRGMLQSDASDEYTRIFIGPGNLPAAPYESPYKAAHDMALFQENTIEVRRIYHKHGLRMMREQAIPDDHVSALCAFMAECSSRALDCFADARANELSLLLRDQDVFLHAHMNHWLEEYAAFVRNSKAGSKAVIYPQLLEALAAFVRLDCVFVQEAAFWAEGSPKPDITSTFNYGQMRSNRENLKTMNLMGLSDHELTVTD